MLRGLPRASISHQSHLFRDLGLGSLDLVDLVLKMEDAFKISIPDEDYSKLQTVDQMKAYLGELGV